MAEGVVSFIVEMLGDLLIEEAEALHGVSDRFEQIHEKLKSLQSFLKDADSRQNEQRIRDWVADVRALAYDASDLLESFVPKVKSSKKNGGGIKSILKRYVCMLNEGVVFQSTIRPKIKTIKKRIEEVTTRLLMYGIRSSFPEEEESSSSTNGWGVPLSRHYVHVVVNKQVVGLEEDIKLLVAHLVNDQVYRVVGIHGMGGLGKTTLAQKIYNHPTVKGHFACFAWVCISQKWQKNDVLKEILLKLSPHLERHAVTRLSEDELVKKIFEIQTTKRCLVVLDDIWSNDAWDCLKAAFPAGNFMGSKILLTTRNKTVAEHVADSEGFLHKPKLLDEVQSWELFEKKTCMKTIGAGPRDFHKMELLGREMIKHCSGHPLGIEVLGGILVTKPTLTEWERVHQTIMSSLKLDKGMGPQHQEEVLKVLECSYYNLANQLKLCFLHLSQFPEDSEIETEKLYQMWIAEGFILSKDQREGETMLDVAECYLGELAHRSMVEVQFEGKESSIRKFNSCRLHDLMRDLSLNKAEEEDFFKALGIQQDVNLEISSSTHRRVVIILGDEVIEREYVFLDKKVSRRLRSLILLLDHRSPSVHLQRFLISHMNTSKLLRVLSIEYLDPVNKKFLKVIGTLTNLRYLSLKGSFFVKLPVFNLEHLQTLDLRMPPRVPDIAYLNLLPDILQKMGRLQHLYLPVIKNYQEDKLRLDGANNLETLEGFDSKLCETKDLHSFTNLRKLTIRVGTKLEDVEEIVNYLSSTNSNTLRYSTLKMMHCDLCCGKGQSILRQLFLNGSRNLHELIIKGKIDKLPIFDHHVSFLSSLTMLSLLYTKFEEDPMPTLEKFPNLHSLDIYDGEAIFDIYCREMVCSATGFPRLTKLTLKRILRLEMWRVEEGAMPNLSYLEICDCPRLVVLPDGLRSLTALRELKITDMSDEFKNKIRIVDGQEGEDFYKVRHVDSVTFRNY